MQSQTNLKKGWRVANNDVFWTPNDQIFKLKGSQYENI